MGITNIDIRNEDVDYKKHTLSAILKADSFVYGIFDGHALVSVRTHENVDYRQPDSLVKDRVLSEAFASVSVSSGQRPFLHLSEKDDDVLQYYPSFRNKEVFVEHITGQKAFTYFGISSEQNQFLTEQFGKRGFSLHHISTALAHQSFPGSEKLLAHIEDKKIHLMAFANGAFSFYNQFECNCKEDFLYYTLLVYNQLRLEPDTFPLHLSGTVDKISETYQILYSYIRHIRTTAPVLLKVDAHHPRHYYYNLYATAQCG